MSDELSTALSYWPAGALVVGGVLVVAARYHKYTFRPQANDPREERRMYWWCWLIGGALDTAAMIPNGWTAVMAVGFAAVFIAVLDGPWFRWNRRKWEWSRRN
jgi:hypothetical protein